MRVRKKSWAEGELEYNTKLINSPEDYKGKWNSFFKNENPVHIEIGCGKGKFINTMALLNKDINYIAIERQTQVIVTALRKSREENIENNIGFIISDVKEIQNYFAPADVQRVYINFCDPWPNKKKWGKRRLTHRNFLNMYETIFGEYGEIFFKTDNKLLFEFSLEEFKFKNWKLENVTQDLHNSSFEGNVQTEYEEKFSKMGMPIYRIEAYYKK